MEYVVKTDRINVSTKGFTDIVNITDEAREFVNRENLQNGQLLLFIDGSTAAISTVEYEPGLIKDIPQTLDKLIPMNQRYHHDDTWHDGNGYAHLRSTIVGCSLTVPVVEGRLVLGTWQQIILIDFDNSLRNRKVLVQFVGQR